MNWYNNIENEITINDIPQEYRRIVEKVGIKSFIALIKETGGANFYVPTLEIFLKGMRNRKILTEHNGYNKKELAKKYSMTQRQIYNVVNGK